MQVFIQIQEKTITLEVNSSDTIDDVKEKIRYEEAISRERQLLQFKSRKMSLENGKTLADYKIQNGSTLYLSVQRFGGDWRLIYLYPELAALARKRNLVRMICRKCYGHLPPGATNCRKKKCGGCSDVRRKHGYYYADRSKKYTWRPEQLAGF